MNKVINIFSLFATGIYLLFAFAIIYDLSISSAHFRSIPFQVEILYALSGMVAIMGIIRIARRWQGVKDMKHFKGFVYRSNLNSTAKHYAVLHSSLEILFMLGAILILSVFMTIESNRAFPLLVVMIVLCFESFIFLIRRMKGGEVFAVGINKDVVALFNREMQLFYYTGLLRVEIHYGMIHFKYRGDLSMFLPTSVIPDENKIAFRDQLIETLQSKNVYIDEGFRKWH